MNKKHPKTDIKRRSAPRYINKKVKKAPSEKPKKEIDSPLPQDLFKILPVVWLEVSKTKVRRSPATSYRLLIRTHSHSIVLSDMDGEILLEKVARKLNENITVRKLEAMISEYVEKCLDDIVKLRTAKIREGWDDKELEKRMRADKRSQGWLLPDIDGYALPWSDDSGQNKNQT